MLRRWDRAVASAGAAVGTLLGSWPAWAQDQPAAPAWASPRPWFVYMVMLIVLFGTLLALLFIRAALHRSDWSLADALSEETEVSASTVDANGHRTPVIDASTGKPVPVTEMRASSSRLIALMGMMAILMMFIGFGIFALYAFALTGTMPAQIDKVIYYLMSGMTLFAPYVVNKFSSIFESLSPKP